MNELYLKKQHLTIYLNSIFLLCELFFLSDHNFISNEGKLKSIPFFTLFFYFLFFK